MFIILFFYSMLFYEINNRCNYMQSILFHCYIHSTCFRCCIHPSSGVQFRTRPHLEQVALMTLCFAPVAVNTVEELYAWWSVYKAPETCRVNVAVKWNWLHIVASVGYFIEYIMMHGTINIKYTFINLLQINQRYFSSKNDSVEVFSAYMQQVNLKVL